MSDVKPVNLVMVTSTNHNKYYRMIPQGDTFRVEFGRVGAGMQTAQYPMGQWKKKYNEKIRKGYVDRSDLMDDLIEEMQQNDEYKPIDNKEIADIVHRLQKMAKQTISSNYNVTSNKVTQAMVDKAQDVLSMLVNCDDIEKFNTTLIDLFSVIPRKMSNVSSYIAKNADEFGKIITREQNLLDVMRGQVYQRTLTEPQNFVKSDKTILEAMGLEFYPVDETEIIKIKSCLGSCADRFNRAWRVVNNRTQKRFDEFCDANNITNKKLLWHGSRNENWWSIINTGLVLRPTNAVITGKMFGYGIYYAPKARKSLGYTSLSGSYWAHGGSDTAYMALMNVAYGKPYDVYSFDSKYYEFNYEKLQNALPGANCLHAHEGSMLRNDEIIVYKEEQCTINYLVEIK